MSKENTITLTHKELVEEIRRAFIHGQRNNEMMEAGLERDEVDDYTNSRMRTLIKTPLSFLFKDNLKELFKEQLERTTPIGDNIKNLSKNTYFNGEEITEDDIVLYALIEHPETEVVGNISSVKLELETLNQRHFQLFEGRSISPNGIPALKFKK
jgi:hypothetical protein